MAERLRPGLFVEENFAQPPVIEGVATASGGMVGVSKKGPTDRAKLVTSLSEFERIYGGLYKNNYLPIAARQYFENGGRRLYVSRVTGTGAAAATMTLKDYGEAVNTLKLDAANKGDWGNLVSVNTLKAAAKLTAVLANSNTDATLDTVRGFQIGDVVHIDDGVNATQVIVLSVNEATKKIGFKAVTLGTSIAIGADALTSSTHKARTTLAAPLNNAQTSVLLASARSITKGSRLLFANGTESLSVIVTGVSGNTVQFAAVTMIGTMAIGTLAVSVEFDLRVMDEGNVVEVHEFLSLEPTNKADYVENRLAGEGNQSEYLVADEMGSTAAEKAIPFPQSEVFLVGGLDGATPTDAEFVGSASDPKTGFYLFDAVDQLNFMSTPGITTKTVQETGVSYCEARRFTVYIMDAPLAADTVQEAEEYRTRTLNVDSSRAALYWPWLVIVDPEAPDLILQTPPAGPVQGIWAAVAQARGVHKAPANEPVRGVLGLITDGKSIDYDAAQDILNPIGVNVIRPFSGRGIRVFGARTLASVKDGRHYVHVRRTLNFVEQSILNDSLFAVFEPIDEDLYRQIRSSLNSFLEGLWREGALAPRDDIRKAFFVKVDSETTTQADANAGRVNVVVGVNIVGTAEQVVFRITSFQGQKSVEEIA